jgi:hypothetical protein
MDFNSAFCPRTAGPSAYHAVKQTYAAAGFMTAKPVVFSVKDNAYLDSLRLIGICGRQVSRSSGIC